MWIIPKNLDAYRFVQDTGGLNLDLSELSQICEQSLMWRSKHSQRRTWLARWSRVSWMSHLSGRILRPSTDSLFVERYTSSLPAIPVKESRSLAKDRENKTPDGFGRILRESLRQLNLFSSSGKTSADTLPLDSPQFTEAYEIWVTQLRQDYLVRQSAELHTDGNGCLSWPTIATGRVTQQMSPSQLKRHSLNLAMTVEKINWPTMAMGTHERGAYAHRGVCKALRQGKKPKVQELLVDRVTVEEERNWPTPEAQNQEGYQIVNGKKIPRLGHQAKWPTPKTPTGGGQGERQTSGGGIRKLEDALIINSGLLDQGNPNTNGKSQELWPTPNNADSIRDGTHKAGNPTLGGKIRKIPHGKSKAGKLNPDWVEQLQGLPVGWTDCGFSETELSPNRRKGHSDT